MLYYMFHTFSMSKLISKNDFRDNCGFGLIAHINGKKSHDIVIKSINALESWYMLGKQSRAISPRIFLLRGTFLKAIKFKLSFFNIFFILGRTKSI